MADQNDDVKEATLNFVPGFHTMFESCDIVLTRDVALFENDIGRRLPFGLFDSSILENHKVKFNLIYFV